MRARNIPIIATGLTCVLFAAGYRMVLADEHAPGSVEDLAHELADEVLRGTDEGADGLDAWTRSVIEGALERAARDASRTAEESAGTETGAAPAPLPAERNAAQTAVDLSARPNTAQVIVFTSMAVPAASWRQWSFDAARIGAPMVLRGVSGDGFQEFVRQIGVRIGDSGAGAAIDPRLFRLFAIEAVPAVAVVPGGVPACTSLGCADDPAPPHDLVTGNIGIEAALEAIAAEGGPGRETARRHLALLRGETE